MWRGTRGGAQRTLGLLRRRSALPRLSDGKIPHGDGDVGLDHWAEKSAMLGGSRLSPALSLNSLNSLKALKGHKGHTGRTEPAASVPVKFPFVRAAATATADTTTTKTRKAGGMTWCVPPRHQAPPTQQVYPFNVHRSPPKPYDPIEKP